MPKKYRGPFDRFVLKQDASLVELVVATRNHLKSLTDLFSEFVQDDDGRRLTGPSFSTYNQRLLEWQAMRIAGKTDEMPEGLTIYFVSEQDNRGVFIGLDSSAVGCTDKLTVSEERNLFRAMCSYLEKRK